MGQAAVRYDNQQITAAATHGSPVRLTLINGGLAATQREILFLGITLAILQVLDGALM